MFREEESENYLENVTEEKRMKLYFLYLYHINYENEPREKKAIIREYYEKELRYRGAFYKDKKVFSERGNPLDWEVKKLTRYKMQKNEMPYYRGMNTYSNFVYPTTTLVEIELSKRVEILLVNREKRLINLNLAYINNLRDELNKKKDMIIRIDSKNHKVYIQKGFSQPEFYDLSDLQIVFKINTGDYLRYISTPFMTDGFVIEKGMNLLENYLAQVTKLDELGEEFTGKYKEYDEDFYVERCVLERVYVLKRTNIYDTLIKRRSLGGYDLEINSLRSINIKEVVINE